MIPEILTRGRYTTTCDWLDCFISGATFAQELIALVFVGLFFGVPLVIAAINWWSRR